MFFPKCPQCGGRTESVEPDHFEQGNRFAGQVLRRTAHRHPYLQAAHLAATVGRAVYKRVPGGGEKRCTVCDHHFH